MAAPSASPAWPGLLEGGSRDSHDSLTPLSVTLSHQRPQRRSSDLHIGKGESSSGRCIRSHPSDMPLNHRSQLGCVAPFTAIFGCLSILYCLLECVFEWQSKSVFSIKTHYGQVHTSLRVLPVTLQTVGEADLNRTWGWH